MAAKKNLPLPSVMELAQEGFDVLREHSLLFFKIHSVGYLPALIAALATQYLFSQKITNPADPSQWVSDGTFSNLAIFNIVSVVATIWWIYSTVVVMYAAGLHFLDKKKLLNTTIPELFRFPVSKIGALIVTNFIASFSLIFLFLLLVVPGLIYSMYWSFIVEVVLFTNLSGTEAMSRSKALVEGRWWKVFTYFFGLGMISLIITVASQWGSQSIGTLTPELALYIPIVFNFVSQFIVIAITISGLSLYFKLDKMTPIK